jgi:hypothetical protein
MLWRTLTRLILVVSGPWATLGGAQGAWQHPARPADGRVLGLEVNQPEGFDHAAELERARGVGVGLTQLTMPWAVLEPTAGALDVSFLAFGLGFYRSAGVGVLLSIPVVDTIEFLLPADLDASVENGTLRLSDASVVARFEALLDALLAVAGTELDYLCLSNEVDIALGPKPDSVWSDLRVLLDAGIARIHAVRPDVQIGASATFGGLSDPRLTILTRRHDVRFMTYYVAGNFGGGTGGNVERDFQRMLLHAGTKPLVLKECGYATGPSLGGSRAGQAAFVRQLFTSWDRHSQAIPCIVLSRMFDGVRSECEALAAYYGLAGDQAFIEFLCTLGLRGVSGAPKAGWDALEFEARRRGFH